MIPRKNTYLQVNQISEIKSVQFTYLSRCCVKREFEAQIIRIKILQYLKLHITLFIFEILSKYNFLSSTADR